MRSFFFVLLFSVGIFSSAQESRVTLTYADTLELDLFLPAGEELRPLLIYVHGGGFAGGERDHPDHIAFCKRMTERGWAAATISYHLTMKGKSFSCDQQVSNKIYTLLESARNINQSVAYLHEQASKFRLDMSKVVIAGSSAGAEAILHAAYWPSSRDKILDKDFQYAGVISMAGALLDQRWINAESAIPTALFHGTCDRLVPYGQAPHHYCQPTDPGYMMLFGSEPLANRLESVNQSFMLVTDCGGGHEWNILPIRPPYIHHIDRFLESVINGENIQSRVSYAIGTQQCKDLNIPCK